MNTPARRRGDIPTGSGRQPALALIAFGVLVLAVTLVVVQAIGMAFTLAGLNPMTAGLVLLASLLGSAVNIPVARITTGRTGVDYLGVRAFGVVHIIPVRVAGRTTIAVNLGGAVIPTAVSVYLVARTGLWVEACVAVITVAVVVHLAAQPLPQVGIVLSPVLPALTAALVAIVLHTAGGTAALAYVAGTVGTLIGADLTHLSAIRRLRAPVVSIGGAGTFDGVFLTGIIAVLLAAFV